MSLQKSLRGGIAAVTRSLPVIPGLGRVVLAMDACLTNSEPQSYFAEADVNQRCRLKLDLRGWEQKFAFYYGRWEQELIAAVQRHFTTGVFYDVGASVGLYATTFGRICQSRGTYLRAFEPVPDNIRRLREQLVLNQLDERTVRIEPVALGEAPGTVQLTLVDDGRPGNAKIIGGEGIACPMTTLDDVWRTNGCEPVGFLKIDTEGWDALVLRGGREMLARCRPNLLVEFNRERMHNLNIPFRDSWNLLVNELNYSCYRIPVHGAEVPLADPGEWENLLFVAEESRRSSNGTP